MPAAIASVVNAILKGLVAFVNVLVVWLPDSPFQDHIAAIRSGIGSELLGYVNYFLPISEFLAVLSVWVTAILIYYAASVVLRWIKAVS